MPYQVHFRPWVLWWIYTGIVCGIVALVNILFRDLSSLQIAIVIGMGVLFWTVGGIVAYGYGGVRIVSGYPPLPAPKRATRRSRNGTLPPTFCFREPGEPCFHRGTDRVRRPLPPRLVCSFSYPA
ncbi:MAG TPA: hypothetical protein VEF06_09565 [Bryobacteraceae bacterium]|nr:hypothetical protein [Bryobacteraceae bacterium]